MEKLCPICNSISTKHVTCQRCGEFMEDMGRNSQYYDSYSAEAEINNSEECIHLYHCNKCNEENLVNITEIFI